MRLRRRGATPPPALYYAAYNGGPIAGGAAGNNYAIGLAFSPDGTNWQSFNNQYTLAAGTGWESSLIKDPSLIWDGSQWVMYYAGYDGTTFQIGRATSPRLRQPVWTRYGSNPVVAKGTIGDPDQLGCEFPVVHYDGTTWRMWYQAYPSGFNGTTNPIGTVCFADSSDGITWTKHGTVIARGGAGSFNEIDCQPGTVYKSGSTWYVYFGGFRATDFFSRSAYVTTTNPASSGSYSAATQLSNYTGNITVGGRTWQSNLPRGIRSDGAGGYIAYLSVWKPTDTSTILESCVRVTSTDLTSWATPSALMLPFEGWNTLSSENPSVVTAV